MTNPDLQSGSGSITVYNVAVSDKLENAQILMFVPSEPPM